MENGLIYVKGYFEENIEKGWLCLLCRFVLCAWIETFNRGQKTA